MKPVTGKTSLTEGNNLVSIQLKLGGHSFSVDAISAQLEEQKGGVEFVALTHKTTLIPREEFAVEKAASYLQLSGCTCGADETAVWSDLHADVVAVMALSAECVEQIRVKCGEDALFTSPLLPSSAIDCSTVSLCQIDELLYIKVYEPQLRFAEVVRAVSEADLIYYTEQLSGLFCLSGFTARISGISDKTTINTLRNYFSRVICE